MDQTEPPRTSTKRPLVGSAPSQVTSAAREFLASVSVQCDEGRRHEGGTEEEQGDNNDDDDDDARDKPPKKKHKKKVSTALAAAVREGVQEISLETYRSVLGADAKLELNVVAPETVVKTNDVQELLLWILADGVSPKWAFVKHRLLAHHVVVVMAHSLGPDTFESHRDALAHLGSSERFPWSLQAQAPSSRLRLQSPLDGLLLSPLTKEQRKSVKNSKAAEVAGKPYGLTDCLLTIEQLTRDEYPTLSAALGGKLVSRESGYRDITTDSTVTVDDANPTAPFFAIDCEMVRTSEGLELARTSVLDQSGTVLYDQYNIPDRPILDYNTQYSGITPELLKDVTRTVSDVQRDLLALFPPNAILLGHSLDNDMRCLRLCHHRIVDTSVLFSHTRGPSFKPALRWLVERFLSRQIQTGNAGHSSIEDARAVLDLVALRLQKGPRFGVITPDTEALFSRLERNSVECHVFDRPNNLRRHTNGSSAVHCTPCPSDEEVAQKVALRLQQFHTQPPSRRQLIFAQLLSLHSHFNGEATETDAEEERRTVTQLDSNVGLIYEAVPPGSLMVVLTGHGSVREMRRVREQGPAAGDDADRLMEAAVSKAKRALVFLAVKEGASM